MDTNKLIQKIKLYDKQPEPKFKICKCIHMEYEHDVEQKCIFCICPKFELLAELTRKEIQVLKEIYFSARGKN